MEPQAREPEPPLDNGIAIDAARHLVNKYSGRTRALYIEHLHVRRNISQADAITLLYENNTNQHAQR